MIAPVLYFALVLIGTTVVFVGGLALAAATWVAMISIGAAVGFAGSWIIVHVGPHLGRGGSFYFILVVIFGVKAILGRLFKP